ncbi:MAG: hypothetical protein sL5_07840 [Candidatus Mesenet longicola]|uniref:Uncharacterized protein n=1 Tax=Candidatus Mesenet longicola TaxID=1892558 RepID=A0A8J3HYB1_9RICK|nr:MAG: hypothetical protein sGL2_08620 [Candidatus Mesenet longicola]GHM59791.1 MAG: hypothetical protein sL5_07840 [Candidatus Mesenet longicola]
MLGINEIDQLAIITEEDIAYPEDIFYPSEEDVKICILNLQKSESGLTPEEEYQFCHMVCTEDKNAEICSILIESDNQII